MSGVAGGNRIEKADVQKTFDKYTKEILEKIPGFKKATLSGSVKVGAKPDYGDLDLVTWFEGDDKKEVKQRIIKLVTSLPDSVIVPFKSEKYTGRKYYNSGEIITVLYPIVGKQDQFIQVDNIISLTEEEHGFKNNFLDLPAEKQGLILGLVKVILLEERPEDIFKRLSISDVPPLGEKEEYEFNLSSGKLTLRKVKLENFREVGREEIWSSTNWGLIKQLLQNYNIDGTFEELLDDVSTKLKNPRSRNRIKGIFNSMISVKSGEVGTPKGANKEKALNTVNTVLEQEEGGVVAMYAGGFKPPHIGHFANAEFLSQGADKLVIFIGPAIRSGITITPQQSKEIWEIYSKYLPIPTTIQLSEVSPIKDLYTFVDENKDKYSKLVTGGLKNEMGKFAYFAKNKDKYPNVEVVQVPVTGESEEEKFSATDVRSSEQYIKSGKWVPSIVSDEDEKKIISILLPNTSENIEAKMKNSLDSTIENLFSPEKKMTKETSSGTPIAPQSTMRSEDRAKLVRVYNQLRDTLGDNFYTIEFKGDHVQVSLKQKTINPSFDYTPYMASILEYMIDQKMKVVPLPEIKIKKDLVEAEDFFGKTAYYNPNEMEIVLYTQGRHPKDVMRSFAHEMIHHKQNLEGRLGNIGTTDTNEDDHLLEIEKEAYLEGNITFRNWEDSIKNEGKKKVMNEGRYDKISNIVSNRIFNFFKEKLKTEKPGDKIHKLNLSVNPYEDADIESDTVFDLQAFIKITDDKYSADGGANAGYDDDGDEITPLINIAFQVPTFIDLQELSMDIKDVVRHEIEHLTQDGENLKRGKYIPNDQKIRDKIETGKLPKSRYYKLPKEVDAMIQGMYYKAKKSRTPFPDVVDNYFDKVELSPQERIKVKELWNKRLPALGIKQRL